MSNKCTSFQDMLFLLKCLFMAKVSWQVLRSCSHSLIILLFLWTFFFRKYQLTSFFSKINSFETFSLFFLPTSWILLDVLLFLHCSGYSIPFCYVYLFWESFSGSCMLGWTECIQLWAWYICALLSVILINDNPPTWHNCSWSPIFRI